MAGMRLDIRDEALKPTRTGRAPIVPGDPDKSEIIARISASGPRAMPPASAHKELTAKQKDILRRWVAEGAVYEGHWPISPSHVLPYRTHPIRPARKTRSTISFNSAWVSPG